MGEMNRVHCSSCGYESEELYGVGGDVGMTAEVVSTVVCPVSKTLEDTEAGRITPELAEHMWTEEGSSVQSMPAGPCPKCGQRHPLWDPETAVCPRCGTPGCSIEAFGLWD